MDNTTKLLFFLFISLFFPFLVHGQDFNQALELYRAEQYEEALAGFEKLEGDRPALFAGKTHLAMGNYSASVPYLYRAVESTTESIAHEAIYTLAISHFRLKNYDRSLNYLNSLLNSGNRTGLIIDGRRLYEQIINFLTPYERFQTLRRSESPQVRYDLVNLSKTFLDPDIYSVLVKELLRLEPDTDKRDQYRETLFSEDNLSQSYSRYPTAPPGTVYHIGVVLPTFDEHDPDFTIPRNLYYGMVLAADEFNTRNSAYKVKLLFSNSAEDPDTTALAFTELVWAQQADVVLGPLFSEPASRMAQLAEEYRVPMLAPLANSDEINLDYNYTFQLNPTFEVHGRNMARFAVEELGLDTLAIVTEKESLGRASAISFRHEAERLGAHISYYIEEDFASLGYDVSEFTKVFTPDSLLIDSLGYTPSQAIYAPFTGQAAPTLTNLFLNDLEAMRSNAIILGSEEWKNAGITAFQNRFFEIYYSQAFGSAADSTTTSFFEQDFETRFGFQSDRFAKIGYDTANYVFQSLEMAGNPAYLPQVLRSARPYNGLSLKIDFDKNRVNQHVYILPLTPRAREKMTPSLSE